VFSDSCHAVCGDTIKMIIYVNEYMIIQKENAGVTAYVPGNLNRSTFGDSNGGGDL
jgi:hypothetical protein